MKKINSIKMFVLKLFILSLVVFGLSLFKPGQLFIEIFTNSSVLVKNISGAVFVLSFVLFSILDYVSKKEYQISKLKRDLQQAKEQLLQKGSNMIVE